MDRLNVKKGKKKRRVLAFSNVINVCYVKVTMNNIYGMCWLVLLFFFSLCTSQTYVQLQMGGIFLAGHICSMGGNCCASPGVNPFEMDGPEVRPGLGSSPGAGGSWLCVGMNPHWRCAGI